MSGPRVIAGMAKGRRLYMVPGEGTRPIADRAKQALFNIIGPEIQNARFLDLFAGTGSVGIEALSRGAAFALFVDANHMAIRTIRSNLELTGLVDKSQIDHRDAFQLIEKIRVDAFDYVFIAPPQYHGIWERAVLAVDDFTHWLNPDAWVIAQMHPGEYRQLDLDHLIEFDQRRYGSTLLVFYEFPGG
jgi:16S rRNA (guanine966-N2)-methyltransferase